MGIDWEWVALGADAAFSLLFYTLWKKNCRSADNAEKVQQVYIGTDLERELKNSKENALPYVCIEGVTEAVGPPLRSMYKPECESGVIQKISLIEHRSRRTQGYWTDSRRVIRDATNTTPFQLVCLPSKDNEGTSRPVQVIEALTAEYLMDDLKVTYDNYEPNQSTMMEKGVDRLFGDVSKGFQETEKMLNVGVRLLGLGRVELDADGKIKLMPPLDGQRYILTTLTKGEAVRILRSRARVMKFFFLVFGAIGTGVVCYWGYKKFRAWKRDREMRLALEEFRRQKAGDTPSNNDEASEDNCLICFSTKREVVLLNCGHICMCANCAQELPEPKHCPVCRRPVEKIQPIYMS